MNKATKIILALLVAGALVTMVAFTLTKNKEEVEAKVYHPEVNAAVTVQADTVSPALFDQTTAFTGSFEPNREVAIGSETAGKVIKVNVEEGSRIGAGGLIAQLDNELLQVQLRSAQANYDIAVNTLNRYEQAVSGITQLQLDRAKTDILTSKGQIDLLKKQISQYRITAPFGGIVTTRNFDLGAIVSPGMAMATLTDNSALKLVVNVPENSLSQFKNGQRINVTTDVFPGEVFQGKVDLIASKADNAHNFTVKILVPNPKYALKAGMYGTISLNNAVANQALTIPRAALFGTTLKPQVYVIDQGVARLRDIELGTGNETRIQVLKGLQEGDVVVSGGLVNLSEGVRVMVVK
ncbi:RND family efflux transporter MFP subunit [Dyadobacter jejuensis]|uniref:RND family efflux transporter MFP subunit n=1 Tax=Dyadobacter jejuensis TaxID=1082580 RepID=A0A316AQK4_9BACT|nr:efflux RND transporter periplasmic adaptor subunit [Dyadobacter jejuensis]PWJ59474.1 RND family efflux transporter MFP subunit [Dyadobacter jejuensis]